MLRSGKISVFLLLFLCGTVASQVSSSGCYISGALIDPSSTGGCGNSGTNNYCNLASLYVPAFSPTACGTSTSSGGVSHAKATVYTLPAGCTATIEAEFRNRAYLGVGATATGCGNSAMDGSGDQLYISQSGGAVSSQGATLTVPNSTCAAYPALGMYTMATSSINPGCNNSDGYVKMILTGGTFTVGGNSNRADEIITFTINMSGTCGPSCSAVLPVELVSFSGQVKNNTVDLRWRVATEQNVDHYLVEKSRDGENWQHLAAVPASNKTYASNVAYSLTDHYPEEGINYYKLMNIDVDNKNGPPEIIAVNYRNGNNAFWFEQNDEKLIIHLKEKQRHTSIQLLDNSAKLVEEITDTGDSGDVSISKKGLNPGIYVIRLLQDDQLLHSKVIIY